MVIEVNWTKQALEDIDSIANFIARDSEHYAIIQTERIFYRARILESQPMIGRVVPELSEPEIRQLLEGNYRIIDKIISVTRVDVLTVHHQNRLLANNPMFKE